jgi:hypothetical protein
VAVNLENAAKVVWDFHEQSSNVLVSAMKTRAVAFEAFDHPWSVQQGKVSSYPIGTTPNVTGCLQSPWNSSIRW